MRRPHLFGMLSFGLSIAVAASAASAFERELSVMQGPETVFDRPPAQILPALAGAKATGENGRVGNELVFWGYQQQNGQNVFFFACALLENVDCPQRVQAVCPANTVVLETQQTTGNIVRRSCRPLAVAAPGELRPGCDDREQSAGLLVGLVSCG